jgi:hypothetical protein
VSESDKYYKAKSDLGKPSYRLIPFNLLDGLARIREYGVAKYGAEDSWKDVPDARKRYTDALLRHIFAWMAGEKVDKESGLRHIDHALCNLVFLLHFEDK